MEKPTGGSPWAWNLIFFKLLHRPDYSAEPSKRNQVPFLFVDCQGVV
jgi:hypothetical protein